MRPVELHKLIFGSFLLLKGLNALLKDIRVSLGRLDSGMAFDNSQFQMLGFEIRLVEWILLKKSSFRSVVDCSLGQVKDVLYNEFDGILLFCDETKLARDDLVSHILSKSR